jgi:hypothetical protein
MSNIASTDAVFFVNYQITPIPGIFKNSLYQYLLENVWGERGMADEDIRVLVCNSNEGSWIREIRYQFGEDFDLELIKEIGDLVEKQITTWSATTKFKS